MNSKKTACFVLVLVLILAVWNWKKGTFSPHKPLDAAPDITADLPPGDNE